MHWPKAEMFALNKQVIPPLLFTDGFPFRMVISNVVLIYNSLFSTIRRTIHIVHISICTLIFFKLFAETNFCLLRLPTIVNDQQQMTFLPLHH